MFKESFSFKKSSIAVNTPLFGVSLSTAWQKPSLTIVFLISLFSSYSIGNSLQHSCLYSLGMHSGLIYESLRL